MLTKENAELRKLVDELADALGGLRDWQNVVPLPRHEKQWTAALQKADELLRRLGK